MRRRAIEKPTPKSVELPPEIWDQIAGHLQGNTLVQLMGLNRVFMQHALREKYSEANLIFIDERGYRKLESIHNEEGISDLGLHCCGVSEVQYSGNPTFHPRKIQIRREQQLPEARWKTDPKI
ncbi:hypothetical protein FA15DRAFT_706638 [Coprinopsis marcescibilis]|uniref:F-box domain-containing protein n=1 Tax=Coprinopsis marcescibilis TaxID=230819 RepID=A0A5C3KNU1_COPMA|nr:hypothetical protein FA15DRAFT_706638 [Coprinopsis marcescibilis]